MNRRQTIPRQWLIIGELRAEDEQAVRRLARGSGILVVVTLAQCSNAAFAGLRSLAASRSLVSLAEAREGFIMSGSYGTHSFNECR